MEEVGPLPQRAPVGHRPRGLQRERRRLELLHPRPGPLARLPLGRGRPGRHLRRQAAALLRAGAVERQGPDPQGAALRPDQQRGQPRRGREGVLLLPRQHADPLVHEVPLQVSAGAPSPTPTWWRRNRRRGREEMEYELLDTGVFDDDRYFDVFVEYAKAAPEDILVRITVGEPRTGGRRAAPPADALVPQQLVGLDRRIDAAGSRALAQVKARGGHERRRRAPIRCSATTRSYCEGDAPLLFTENETNNERLFPGSRTRAPTSRTASTTTWSRAGRTP